MRWQIIIRPNAENDLHKARLWYEARQPGLGSELDEAVNASIHVLGKEPGRYPVYYRNFRKLMTRRFPYKIFYRVDGEKVIVFRILHSKQDHKRLL